MKSPLELRFISTVKREGILPPGSSVTAAVSGGADSVCMLHLLLRFRRHMSWNLSVLHIDHSYRKSSRADASSFDPSHPPAGFLSSSAGFLPGSGRIRPKRTSAPPARRSIRRSPEMA